MARIILYGFLFVIQCSAFCQTEIQNFHPYEYMKEGESLLSQGNKEKAFQSFERAYAIYMNQSKIDSALLSSLRMGYALLSQKKFEEAVDHYVKTAQSAKSNNYDSIYLQALDAVSTTKTLLDHPREAIPIMLECLAVSKKLGMNKFYSTKILSLGFSYFEAGEIDSARLLLEQGRKLKLDLGDDAGVAMAAHFLGTMYHSIGDYERAQTRYLEANTIRKELGDSINYAMSFRNLANVFIDVGDWDRAHEYALQGFKIADQLKLDVYRANLLSTLAFTNLQKGLTEIALQQYEETIDTYRASNKNIQLVRNLLKVGNIYMDQGNTEKANEYISDARKIAINTTDQAELVNTSLAFGALYLKSNQPATSLPYLQEAASISDATQLAIKYKRASQLLAKAYSELGQYKDAYEWKNIYSNMQDSLFQQDRQEVIYEMETRFQVNEKEQQINLLNAQNDLQNLELKLAQRRQLALILGLLVVGSLTAMVYFFYRSKKRDSQLLREKNEVISSALKEKELLLREIHHRVKNNLQVISSLLSIQSRQIQDVKAQDAVREGKDRVRSMALIHESLYRDSDILAVDSADYIDKLIHRLFSSYNIDPERISLDTKIDSMKLDVDIMIPLGLILNELISNALKYAFADGRNGILSVQLENRANKLELEVSDNGVGVREDFNLENVDSTGFLIIKDFCTKLKAALSISNTKGTKINVSIPMNA